jgi:hypothetical protein
VGRRRIGGWGERHGDERLGCTAVVVLGFVVLGRLFLLGHCEPDDHGGWFIDLEWRRPVFVHEFGPRG